MNFINNNNNITLNLLEAVRVSKINPVIQIYSTSEVYGQVKKNETPIKETNRMRPTVHMQFKSLKIYVPKTTVKILIKNNNYRMFTYLNQED